MVIVDPPYYFVGLVFLSFGLVLVLATALAASQRDMPRSVIWVGLFFALPSLFAGTWVCTDKAVLIFDRGTQTMTVKQQKMFIFGSHNEVPLNQVDRAEVEAGRGTRRLVILTNNGGAIGVGSHTTQAGQYEMVKAINDFLAGH
jgi:hypothetical protein